MFKLVSLLAFFRDTLSLCGSFFVLLLGFTFV